MRFYLGTHRPNWLELIDVPLFVSHRTLGPRKRLPRALGQWALDSGGFSELSMYGAWRTTLSEYVEAVERYREIGGLEWAAPQDWMCEPFILEKTGLSVREHQERTVQNYLDLRDRGPFIPVLQGFEIDEYIRCADLYDEAGVDLTTAERVGIGSVCRRQGTSEIGTLIKTLYDAGISCHGFGVKTEGLLLAGRYLKSADSMAWSYRARRSWPLPGCTHKRCANCPRYALKWRRELLAYQDQLELVA